MEVFEFTRNAWIIAGLAVLVAGVSKAGFGSGPMALMTPIAAMAIPARLSLAILLPLLCAIDLLSIGFYWRQWDRRNIAYLLPGAVCGIAAGALVLRSLSNEWLGMLIGALAMVFAARYFWQLARRLDPPPYRPKAAHGALAGLAAGAVSMVAHAAGPITQIYLLPQRMEKRLFVGTTVVFFAAVNATKLIPYSLLGLFTAQSLRASAALLPFVPMGVALGLWLNRRISQTWFMRVVHAMLLLAGAYLLAENGVALSRISGE